ncbi:hypothetical protein LOD99_7687 [Oopsacas minuta]|uniref:Uncharacterized protein n=1 Tax=Oopsacas minuta TaxID=111878 RepID=A0AAV7JP70_9METZ|nr:hypothetical protein LOD99_7687 [Oopsacas minuta]
MKGFNRHKKRMWSYPDLDSARRPVLHCEEVPLSKFNPVPDLSIDCDGIDEDLDTTCHFSESEVEVSSSLSGQFNQEELNDLIRDLNLSKECSEILASRLNEKNIHSPGTKITYYRHIEEGLLHYFNQQEGLVFCNDIGGLLLEMGIQQYRPEDWRLFIIVPREA